MRFSFKIFLCTVVTVAISFAAGGYLLISNNFVAAKNREISLALEEHLSLQYLLESAMITRQLQGQAITDDTIRSAAQDIAKSLQQNGRDIQVFDTNGAKIYSTAGGSLSHYSELSSLKSGQVVYDIEQMSGGYHLIVTGLFAYGPEKVYLSYVQDISQIYNQQETQIRTFMIYQGFNILLSAALALLISWLLTRPIRQLTQTSRKISMGSYGERAEVRSSDEVGELAQSFNAMASSVEEKIHQLEQASQNKDDFIANFTHELKTPMTSILGYADMLRSRQLEPQTAFKAAQYIYSEANRLETLSLKMLDLIMLEKEKFQFVPISCPELAEYIAQVVTPSFEKKSLRLQVSAQDGFISADPDLFKTMLINLADNAGKASPEDGTVELCGRRDGENYLFSVSDHGQGIPPEELSKITEAFYMVDKSRSRAQNGVGLGLAIASRIAALHHTTLQFQSSVGVGTTVNISMPSCSVQEVTDET